MRRRQCVPELVQAILLVAASAGCDPDPDGDAPLQLPAHDAGPTLDSGAAPILVPDASSSPPSAVDATSAPPATGADTGPGTIMLGGAEAGPGPAAIDAGPIIINIPTRSVPCGASECTTTSNRTCCQSWSFGAGFEGAPSCTTVAACEADHPTFGETNRAVLSECDEPSDCSGGNVCCFVRYGMPVIGDIFSGEQVGPGASRLCMSLSNCNAGMMSFSGVLGVPIGLLACKSSADCQNGGSCMPEQPNSASTGKDGAARPGVLLCR